MGDNLVARFEISGAIGPVDPFGSWQAVQPNPAPAAVMVSFGFPEGDSPEPVEPEAITWRVDLPREAEASIFDEHRLQLEKSRQALESAPQKLDTLTASLPAQSKAAGDVHFSAPADPEMDGPDAELLALLDYADTPRSETVSFGFTDSFGGALAEARQQFQAILDQVNHELLQFAWVETCIEGRMIARSSLDWNGDATTFWQAAASRAEMSLHQQSLQTVIETRTLRLRLVALVTSCALRVSAMLATPGGQVMAVPIAYRYITAILNQVKK